MHPNEALSGDTFIIDVLAIQNENSCAIKPGNLVDMMFPDGSRALGLYMPQGPLLQTETMRTTQRPTVDAQCSVNRTLVARGESETKLLHALMGVAASKAAVAATEAAVAGSPSEEQRAIVPCVAGSPPIDAAAKYSMTLRKVLAVMSVFESAEWDIP